MSIQVQLNHVTTYTYDRPVSLGPQVVRLRPAAHCRTPILGYSLEVEPSGHFQNWQQDPFGNFLARLVFPDKVERFQVSVSLTVDLVVVNPFDFFLEEGFRTFPFRYGKELVHELSPCLETAAASPLVEDMLAGIDLSSRATVDFLVDLNRLVNRRVQYLIRMEAGVQTPEETLAKGSGSCRDSAWLLVHLLRRLGLAARFVSGYLIQLAQDRKSLDGPSGPDADFTDLHAWCEVYLPGAGWVGLDPTSGLFAGEGHIPLAASPSPSSAAPISGGVEKCETEFEVKMEVVRLPEAPRSTRPYDDETWRRIDQLGRDVEKRLSEGDVRLTMGGEPTFVSIDDFDGPQWNTEALGEDKRKLAHDLLLRLRGKFSPGGALHHGQGKLYPGESLPRWAYKCIWREDGEPLWSDATLFADERNPHAWTDSEIQGFLTDLSRRLGVDPSHALPGYEDAWYWMWRERRLPVNVDPHESNLADPEERARIARVFEQGLDKVVGLALPLRARDGIWQSGPWSLRSQLLYLIPGDSPMGYRLPLDGLPWADRRGIRVDGPLDPTVARGPLPPRSQARPGLAARPGHGAVSPSSPADMVRTALCLEMRNGMLHVFMPPVSRGEEWVDLVGAIEATAAATGMPVRLEGYPPPWDPRLSSFAITPDPGVIEVNVHPSSSWDQLRDRTETLYEEARSTRLGTEKFLVDGRLAGTGGGNHITLGGRTPVDSPFLRRPDLLASLLGYWMAHPSLSYVFSGMFVGPTSQAPRVDEARSDATHELDLALRQIPSIAGMPPWMVDRVLRNLLVDATGNTHRSEFCIDKLFSPDSSTGRLGIVELRAFEMPPHERMSLVQQLLVRSLVAKFWVSPWKGTLPRWNNILHDRFALPHFLERDLAEVCADLTESGMDFPLEWFRPHLEFRFPRQGGFVHEGVDVEIRTAIEPWHVLGEETTGSGTARYVDSSMERLQVKVSNLTPGRHEILCNGVRLPLAPTGTEGQSVCGVRFRAWNPPSALHPTVGIHGPLVFDLFDGWSRRAVRGLTYHVMHPGGRAYEGNPVNGNEAASRRFERIQPWSRTTGEVEPRTAPSQAEFPLTLDLRWIR
ncbi:MAG TPA: transglutaminase family protein [Fibrobacteria bacterium]|nr:transglutaminase family protein [Fibrobacteria bacterium]